MSVPTGRGATCVIAASDAPDIWKNQADIVVSGNGSDEIQAVLSAGISSLKLSPGTFLIASTLDITSRITIIGSGKYDTKIKLADGANTDLISGSVYGVTLQDLCLDGNSLNNLIGGSGIIGTDLSDMSLQRVRLQNFREHGIFANGGSHCNWRLYDVVISTCIKENIKITGGNTLWITDSYFLTSSKSALHLTAINDLWISHSSFDQMGENGLVISNGGNIWLDGNYFGAGNNSSASGVYLTGTINNLQMAGNRAYQNLGNGFYISANVNNATITGNEAFGNGQWGWRFPGMVAVNVKIDNNIGSSNGAGDWSITELGTGAKYSKNIGYTTENSGTFTIPAGQWGISKAHGLATNATGVQLTLTCNTTANVYVSGITSTNFTANLSALQGSDVTGFWRATIGAGN